jgi:hypothetical protein
MLSRSTAELLPRQTRRRGSWEGDYHIALRRPLTVGRRRDGKWHPRQLLVSPSSSILERFTKAGHENAPLSPVVPEAHGSRSHDGFSASHHQIPCWPTRIWLAHHRVCVCTNPSCSCMCGWLWQGIFSKWDYPPSLYIRVMYIPFILLRCSEYQIHNSRIT